MKLNLLFRKLTVLQSAALILLLLLLTTTKGFSQCTYLPSLGKIGPDYSFTVPACIDGVNSVTTDAVKSGQHVVVNVVSGYTYTFSVGNVFTGTGDTNRENLTIFKEDNTSTDLTGNYSIGQEGTSLTWTSTVTGKIKILLSKNCQNDNTTGGPLTLTLNSTANPTNQFEAGTNQWVGHVYNWPVGTTRPSDPFISTNYVGSYKKTTQNFTENFGGNNVCFPLSAVGGTVNIRTETFAVRYRMQSTVPAGYYFLDLRADDGVRVFVDGVSVFNKWVDQAPTTFCNNLIYLNGNSNIVLEYYEQLGENVINFSLTPLKDKPNLIATGNKSVCSGTPPGLLDGSNNTCTGTSGISYEWQVSSNGGAYGNIAGATTEDYSPPAITATSINEIREYRRVLNASNANAQDNSNISNVIRVTTSANIGFIGNITGSLSQCASSSSLVYSIPALPNALNYLWIVPSGWDITAGQGTTSITVTAGASGQNGVIGVTASNSCGGNQRTIDVTVSAPSVGGTIAGEKMVCSGSTSGLLTLSGYTGKIVRWESSLSPTSTWTTIANTANTYTSGNLTQTTQFRAIVQNGACPVSYSTPVLITANPVSVGGSVSAAQTICSGTQPANLTLSGQTGTVVKWQKTTDSTFNTGVQDIPSTSTTLSGADFGNITANTYFRAVVQSGNCTSANSSSVLIKVYDTLGNNNIFYSNGNSGQVNAIATEGQDATLTAPAGTYFATVNFASYGTPTGTSPNFVINSGCHSATSLSKSEGYLLGKSGSITIPATNAVFDDPCKTVLKSLYILASYAQSICNGSSVTITGNAPTGGVLTYRWESSTTNATAGFGSATGSNNGVNYTSGALTQTTWFRRIVTSCSETKTSSVVMVIVNPAFIAGSIANTGQTICSGGGVPGIIGSTTPASGANGTPIYSWRSSADGYLAAIVGATAATYTPPTGLTVTTSYRRYVTGETCNPDATASANTWTVTVTPANTVGAASSSPTVCLNSPIPAITHATTGATGIGSTATLPTGVTASWSGNTLTISGIPTASGTFNYSIPLTGGCGDFKATGTITVGGISTYNGTSWVGGDPTIYTAAVFSADYNTTFGNITACNCEVAAGKTLTISKDTNVTIQNNIINKGNIIVENDGNLIQNNDFGTYTGTATSFLVKREANLKRLDYNYWASPVKDQQLKTFSPGTVATRFLTYDEKDDFFYAITSTYNFGAKIDGTLESEAKGYAIRANNAYPPATPTTPAPLQVFKGEFKGIPNNGVITFPLKKSSNGNGYNLVGNPYSSNIDFETLYNNNSTNINYVAYFWTNVNPNPKMLGSDYSTSGFINNYAVLNGVGGVPATQGTAALGGVKIPNRYIKVGQGFIVKAINPVNLEFKNTLRKANASSVFFNKNEFSVDRFWLKLTTPLEVVTTQLIGYLSQATNGFELDYDAPLMVLGSDAFYSLLGDQKLAIQGKAPFVNSDAVSLGSSQYKTGNYNISLGDREGIFANGQNIYLKDKQSGTVTNLSETDYTFTVNEGLTEGRFEIVYLPGAVLSTDSNSKEGLMIYRAGNEFVVKSTTKNITGLEVYDTSGRLVQKLKPNHKETRIEASNLINGVYILKINQEGIITSKKVIK